MTGTKSPPTRQAADGTRALSAPEPRRAPGGTVLGPGADLLALQAKVGNRAVGHLLGVGGGAAPPPVVEALARDGRALDPSLRRVMEARLGADLGAVRVHTDARSADSAKVIDAKAYAAGNHVVFGPGRFAPETSDGSRLLAHELTHVVQQRANTFPAPASSLASPAMHPAGSAAEREASGKSIASGGIHAAHAVPAGSVMREQEGEKKEGEGKGVFETILGGLIGDFNQDPSLAEIAINTGVGLIPAVGEATAARDVVANAYWMDKKSDYTSPSLWMGMVFALISLFPEIGAALKGLGKAVVKGAGEALRPILHFVESILAKFGHSEGLLSFFRKHWGQAVAAGLGLFEKVMAKLSSLLTRAVKFISSKAEAFAQGLERVREAAGKLLQPAVEKAKGLFEGVIERFGRQEEGSAAKALEGEAVTAEKAGAQRAEVEFVQVFRRGKKFRDVGAVSLKRLRNVLGRAGVSPREYNLVKLSEAEEKALAAEAKDVFAFVRHDGAGRPQLGSKGRPIIYFTRKGLSSVEEAVKSFGHEVYHLKDFFAGRLVSSEALAEEAGEKLWVVVEESLRK